MERKNKYYKRSKISEGKFREIIRLFSLDIEAIKIAKIAKLNRNTVNKILKGVRERIADFCEKESPFSGVVEVDESFFGAKRIKRKRGRGAYGKTSVFGIYKRNGKVYTEGYNGLVDVGYEKHLRVDHSNNEFVKGKAHINGIEGFWGFSKVRLARFRVMHKHTFYLHLKESEFRFNYRHSNIYKIMLSLCRFNPLN